MKAGHVAKGCAFSLITVFALMSGCAGLMWLHDAVHPNGGNAYYDKMDNLSPEESRCMKPGPYEVSSYEEKATGTLGRFVAYYSKDADVPVPVIISNNGTGWGAGKYPEWFKHAAGWGYIVVGNEEGTSWNGISGEKSLQWILKQHKKKDSPLYNRADTTQIAAIGHSQGGTGAVNSITVQPSSKYYGAAVILASTYDGYNDFLGWKSEASLIRVPTLILVADNDWLTPPDAYNRLYQAIPDTLPKLAARRKECDHGDMLVFADGYVMAFLQHFLKGDSTALRALNELRDNPLYVDARSNLIGND